MYHFFQHKCPKVRSNQQHWKLAWNLFQATILQTIRNYDHHPLWTYLIKKFCNLHFSESLILFIFSLVVFELNSSFWLHQILLFDYEIETSTSISILLFFAGWTLWIIWALKNSAHNFICTAICHLCNLLSSTNW